MAYRPVPSVPRVCVHCNTAYYAKDKRRMYCTSSCNTLAWMARRKAQEGILETLPPFVDGNLSFSVKNVAVTSVGATMGAGVVAGANYLLNDRPANKEMLAKLNTIQADQNELRFGLNQVLQVAQEQIDFIDAMKTLQPGLRPKLAEMHEVRQLKAAERQQKADKVAHVKNKNLPKHLKGGQS